MFLSWKQLREAVGRHVSGRLPFDSDSSRIYLLAKPHLMDIHMAKLRLEAIGVALHKTYSLGVVAPKSLFVMKHETNIAAEAIPVLRFDASG
jgi:hypothetical protein